MTKNLVKQENIRNFSIIAHIDHGKSTLADRFIQHCGGLQQREMKAQVLDSMDIERERGITVKAQCVSLAYTVPEGTPGFGEDLLERSFQLNFIDTPGHVDFSYEVSRSLAACEGALLVVDASQGVEAQTLANCYTALDQGLLVLPVLNKIDLPQADSERVINEIEEIIGIEAQDAVAVSAKTGLGIEQLLLELVHKIPAPTGERNAPLSALIIDSWFDPYVGVVSLICVKSGVLRKKDKIQVMSVNRSYLVDDLGIFTPKRESLSQLAAGEVGYLIAGIKEIHGAPVGDTITHVLQPVAQALPGFKPAEPKVYAGLFPVSSDDYEKFRESLNKLKLNDAALFFEPENSQALGFGFRCGFLGLLHMEIIQERLEREYDLALITTAPTVVYEIELTDGEIIKIDNPAKLPATNKMQEMREPIVSATILTPQTYIGAIMALCTDKRGVQKQVQYLGNQVSLVYELPMNEVVMDFFDKIKSASRGFASVDYTFVRFQPADLVKLDILINGDKVDSLALIVHRETAYRKGRDVAEKMQELIPRQMFDVAIQAAIGSQIIARTTVKALRKNVTAKCYGGDVTRKRKLLEKQKEGKKRMKSIGKVDIPQEAFLAILKVNTDN